MTMDFCGTLVVFFLLAALPVLLTGWVIEGVVLWVKARRVYIPFCALDFFAPMLCVLLWRNLLDLYQESKGMDDIYLETKGWHVVRFWHHDVMNDVEGCVTRVRKTLAERGIRVGAECR